MGHCLFGCHEIVLGLGAALAYARLRSIDHGSTSSHMGIHCTCAQSYGTLRVPNINEAPTPIPPGSRQPKGQ